MFAFPGSWEALTLFDLSVIRDVCPSQAAAILVSSMITLILGECLCETA